VWIRDALPIAWAFSTRCGSETRWRNLFTTSARVLSTGVNGDTQDEDRGVVADEASAVVQNRVLDGSGDLIGAGGGSVGEEAA
jgi:hypothetical protein